MSILTVEDFQGNIKESTSKSFKVGNNYFAAEAKKVGTNSDGSNKYNYNLVRYDGPDLTGGTSIGFLNKNTNKLMTRSIQVSHPSHSRVSSTRS